MFKLYHLTQYPFLSIGKKLFGKTYFSKNYSGHAFHKAKVIGAICFIFSRNEHFSTGKQNAGLPTHNA